MLRIATILALLAIAFCESGCAHPPSAKKADVAAPDEASMADFALFAGAIAHSIADGVDRWMNVTIRPVPLTDGFDADYEFQFTISPDGRWLVFFKQFDAQAEPELDYRYGKLQVVDLGEERLFSFNLRENETPGAIFRGEASWAPDSSYCVFEPPWRERESPNKHTATLIDVRDQRTPRVVKAEVKWGKDPAVTADGEVFPVPDRYGCSDCFAHTEDVELMRSRIDPQHLHFDGSLGDANFEGTQIVSPDGTKIYFQKRLTNTDAELDEVVICELDVRSGIEKSLKTHRGLGPTVKRMRVSPDGKCLAYQVSGDNGFGGGSPALHVLNVASGESQRIAKEAYYAMHWSADSRRLYFYRGHPAPRLSVAEFTTEKPAPQTRPAEQ